MKARSVCFAMMHYFDRGGDGTLQNGVQAVLANYQARSREKYSQFVGVRSTGLRI